MELGSENTLSKELRRKKLEELKRRNELKRKAKAMSQGTGAVSAGPSYFAETFPHVDKENKPIVVLPPVNHARQEQFTEQSFSTPLEERKTTPIKPSYSMTLNKRPKLNRAKEKSIKKEKKLIMYLERGAWIFCAILFLRLMFADRGIVDYYARKNSLNLKNQEYISIHSENEGLISEINQLKHSASYQKKVIRKNLGFIASDEFLVLVE